MNDLPCWAKVSAAILVVTFLFNLPGGSGEVAAWVQAFGSIGAIIGAFKIVDRQHEKQTELRAIAETSNYFDGLKVLEMLFMYPHTSLQMLIENIESDHESMPHKADIDYFDDAADAFRSFPFMSLRDQRLVGHVLGVPTTLRNARDLLKTMPAETPSTPSAAPRAWYLQRLKEEHVQLSYALTDCRKILQSLGPSSAKA